jgi:hypothetical protein
MSRGRFFDWKRDLGRNIALYRLIQKQIPKDRNNTQSVR